MAEHLGGDTAQRQGQDPTSARGGVMPCFLVLLGRYSTEEMHSVQDCKCKCKCKCASTVASLQGVGLKT